MRSPVPDSLRRFWPFLIALAPLAAGCTDRGDDPVGPDPDPVPTAGLFEDAATCGFCHPQHYREWELSTHAFGGSDPVMHALSEIAAQEGGDGIGDECFACHAPALVRQQKFVASLPSEVDPPELDDLSQDGINCDVCHSISIVPPVGSIDFLDAVDPSGPKLGGIMEPEENAFHESVGDNSFTTSIQCAACHQIDLDDGTGLENTYTEWLDSVYGGMSVHCQDCHMPEYSGKAATGGPDRIVHRHDFVGVDYAYEDFRGIDLADQKDRIRALLETAVRVTAEGIPASAAPSEAIDLSIEVHNHATGHSIPSGVSFAREMWIQVTVTDDGGGVIYRSGWLEPNGDLVSSEADSDLACFGSTIYDDTGAATMFTWRAASVDESRLLKALERRTADYRVTVPPGASGSLRFDLALRFRPVKPALLRAVALERLLPIEIFDMWTESHTVTIVP